MPFNPSSVMLDLQQRADYLALGLETMNAVRSWTAKPPPAGPIGGKTAGHYSYAALIALTKRGTSLRVLESENVRKAVCAYVVSGLIAEDSAIGLAQGGELFRPPAGAVTAAYPPGWPQAIAAALRWRADAGMAVLGIHPSVALTHVEPVLRHERVVGFMSREVGENVEVRPVSLRDRLHHLGPPWLDGRFRRVADALYNDTARESSPATQAN